MHRDHLGAHQSHAEDVRRLAFNIFRAHIDAALHTEQRTRQRRGDAVLARTGFGDDFIFAHAFRQQRLTQHLIGFVRAAVQQIFALQVEARFRAFRQVAAQRQRRRASRIVFQQVGEFRLKRRIFLRLDKGRFQLVQRRHQDLRHVHAAKVAKIGVQ